MVFSSNIFIFFFLPACLLLYFLIPGIRAKNMVLLLFSLVFYAWGEPIYLFLILASILLNYLTGLYMERIPTWRKGILIVAVIMNLALLGFFKYYSFLLGIINGIFGLSLTSRNLPLPVGISFYTFQALSYVIDLYRGKIKVQKNVFRFALYISLFPQLIAGPIVRYSEVEQALTDRPVTPERLGTGLMRFSYGFAKKILLANTLGAIYEKTGFQLGSVSALTAWIGIAAYGLQIYFDFSGYSDMAIGLGHCFGFEFPENFRASYGSKSITELWRRHHMSLGNWFKEYVYIPLGGNRVGTFRYIINILIVWGLTGLWHGAGFHFILWGLYFGVWMLFEKYVLFKIKHFTAFFAHLLTIFVFFFGFGMFQSNTWAETVQAYKNMLFLSGMPAWDQSALRILVTGGPMLVIGGFFASPLMLRTREKLIKDHFAVSAVISLFLMVLSIAFMVAQDYNPFLYYRF